LKAAGIDRSMRLHCLTTAPPLAAAQRAALEPLARAIAGTMPGLAGYVGVDLIQTPLGPVIVEVDPRLTTAYVGLAEALDINVAAAVLGVFDQVLAPAPEPTGTGRRTVEMSTAHRPVTSPHP